MAYRLRNGVSFCGTPDGFIFLDLKADRYRALPGSHNESFRRVVEGSALSDNDRDVLAALVAGDLLEEFDGQQAEIRPAAAPAATMSLLDDPNEDCPVRILLESWFVQRIVEHRLKSVALSSAVARVARRKRFAEHPAKSPSDVTRWCGIASQRLRLIIDSRDRCLSRSIALASHLAGKGCPFTLIFGVKLHPFGAHAWVQQRDMVLNSRLDEVAGYTPILAV